MKSYKHIGTNPLVLDKPDGGLMTVLPGDQFPADSVVMPERLEAFLTQIEALAIVITETHEG